MAFERIETGLAGLFLLKPQLFRDHRGYFSELYSTKDFAAVGIEHPFLQDNCSQSIRGVLRGLHFQVPPFEQVKLVTVLYGHVLDVVVDIRLNSPTYGKYFAVELKADDPTLFYIPAGFAHGLCVLSDGCIFSYKCSNYYSRAHEGGILWNDPEIGIPWPIDGLDDGPLLSDKDKTYPLLKDYTSPFEF
jgi:dTDP-4-dehydrorhamnose 3,5-epimerase